MSSNIGSSHDGPTTMPTPNDIRRPEIAVRLPASAMAVMAHLPFAEQTTLIGQHAYKEYKSWGNLQSLETSIKFHRLAMDLTEDDNPKKAGTLAELAISLQARYKCIGELRDLEESISLKQLAVSLTPDDSTDKPGRLMNLAISLKSRYQRGEDPEDLEEAIRLERRGIELAPDGHPHKPTLFNNLGISLKTRFQRSDSTDDLERAISLQRRAVDLTADSDSDKPARLSNLGISLQRRFERLGDLEDLEKAITLHSQSVNIAPDGQPNKPAYLNNAGNALYIRFVRLGDVQDISRAIQFKVRALAFIPDNHPEKNKLLNNVAGSLQARFEKTGHMQDLEQAITHQIHAVELTPDGSPDKLRWLNNLRMQLETRFEQLGNTEDLDTIYTLITPHINAVRLTPDGHPDKQQQLHNLSYSLRQRFSRTGNAADLEEAIRCSARSVELAPKNHSGRARNSRLLGSLFLARLCSPYAQADDTVHAMEAFLEAMRHSNSPPLERLLASDQYASLLTKFSDRFDTQPKLTVLEAWDHALRLVPQCIWLGNDTRGRYSSKEMHIVGTTVSKAAAAAIAAGEYRRALEWLEAGRSVVWSQVLQLRTPLDNLQQLHPQLADDLRRVSQALQHVASSALPPVIEVKSTESSHDADYQSSHSYALEYDKLIARIRKLEGFENFMRPRTFAQLANAGATGPVVIINMHESRCDALILCCAGDVIHVPLPDFSLAHAHNLQTWLWDFLRRTCLLSRWRGDSMTDEVEVEDRGGRVTDKAAPDLMRELLATLWLKVVKPVMDVITTMTLSNEVLPHVTWCPTGPLAFLPLHAAGIYPKSTDNRTPLQTVMDVAISSYTPTLEALLKPRTNLNTTARHSHPRTLIVSQPNTPGYSPISGTTKEAGIVASLLDLSTSRILDDTEGTIEAVLASMATHSWVHLACHGIQDREDPINSAFALYDGRLTLEMLMSKHLSNADLAVLSACQTATGDEKLPEEAVHLAAGMLNVGYKSVIGTMWSISDSSAPVAMKRFYEVMVTQVKAGRNLEPAYALHEATKALRAKYGVSDFVRWIPFVHFGLQNVAALWNIDIQFPVTTVLLGEK